MMKIQLFCCISYVQNKSSYTYLKGTTALIIIKSFVAVAPRFLLYRYKHTTGLLAQ